MPFYRTSQDMAARTGLAPLASGVAAGHTEVRIWNGFGVTGVHLYRAVRDGNHWTTTESTNTHNVATPVLRPWIDGSCWAPRRTGPVADSFFALPPHPVRQPGGPIVFDGWGFVIEIAEGSRYHAAGGTNLGVNDSPDDQRLMRLVPRSHATRRPDSAFSSGAPRPA